MKKGFSAIIICAASLVACAPENVSVGSGDSSSVLTEQEFEKEIVGKTISWVDGTGVPNGKVRLDVHGDGTWSGRGRFDENLSGDWHWEGGFWCRTVVGVADAPADDCLVLRRDQQDYLFIRDRGNGVAVRYRIVG